MNQMLFCFLLLFLFLKCFFCCCFQELTTYQVEKKKTGNKSLLHIYNVCFFTLQMCQAVKAIIILIIKNTILLVSKQVKGQEAQLYFVSQVTDY